MAISGSFTATGQSGGVAADSSILWLTVNFTNGGGGGTVQLEVSHDGGTTWNSVGSDGEFTGDAHKRVMGAGADGQYRLNCTHAAGTITYRLGR